MTREQRVRNAHGAVSPTRRWTVGGMAAFGALATVGGGVTIADASARDLYRDRTMPPPIAGIVPPRGIGGPLPLVDTLGRPFEFGRLGGRFGLLTFGFTQCSSVSPVAVAQAGEILDAMGGPHAPTVLFVTLDPLTDTADVLGAWLRRRDPRIVGLTGEPARVDRVVQAYRVGVRTGPAGLEHAAVWYLIDPSGDPLRVYPMSAGPARIMADITAIRAARA